MATIDRALVRIRQDDSDLLNPEQINQLARQMDHDFRRTTLTPGNTLRLFVQQVAHGNVSCWSVRHLAGEDFSDSAWCQARSRLPIEVLQGVHRHLVEAARRELDRIDDIGDAPVLWHGHRVYVVDGTSDSMPDVPELRQHYGVPARCHDGLGFPTSHLLLLMDHRTGLLVDCVDSPMNTSDICQTPAVHRHLREGDIILGDDAFAGWGHLALLLQAKIHAVMPAHHKRLVDFSPQRPHAHPHQGGGKAYRCKSSKRKGKPRSRVIRVLGRDDQIVEYFKPVNRPHWITDEQWQSLPESVMVREIRRTVGRNGFRPIVVTVVTTLLDEQTYPADELVELRLSRWMVEVNIRHLKMTLGMDLLKCKTLDGVRKERLVFLLVYNLIRMILLRAARLRGVNVNRLSFADTLAWLRLGDLSILPTPTINPLRHGRLEPRVIKRQKKEFPYMTKPRTVLKSQLRATHWDTTQLRGIKSRPLIRVDVNRLKSYDGPLDKKKYPFGR